MKNFELIKSKLTNAISYEEYYAEFKKIVENSSTEKFSKEELDLFNYIKLNYQRSTRIHKTYSPSTEIKDLLTKINFKQWWILITENWCGDSAQNIPYIYEISKLNPIITLKIFKRDTNLDIMDLYLTNGTRSIPKLIAFDENGNELFSWGARPKEAQDLVNKLKSEGRSKDEFIEELHLWYARNKGKNMEKELGELIISSFQNHNKMES